MLFVFGVIVSFGVVACGTAGTPPTTAPTIELPTLQSTTTTPEPTSAPENPNASSEPTTAAATQVPPTGASEPTRPPAPTNNTFTLAIEPIVDGLQRPVFVTGAGDGSGRLFVVEQPGRIRVFQDGQLLETPFLDISDKLTTNGNEQGLLGLAFHPDYVSNGQFFVNYSAAGSGDNIIERYQVSSDPNVADKNSALTILTIPGLESNHNGGMLAFDPDGYLYIGTGDGGGGGDRHGTIGNGQSLDTLLGKILRIDVNAETYIVPANNPFVNTAGALPEIWSYGLRNPWRFSFDRAIGDLYIGEVGQNAQEEIDFQPASSAGGENYGWRIMEGDSCYDEGMDCDNPDLVAPIATYSHDLGCSVTGGYVYRGEEFPWLQGQYIFADYCTGIVWASAQDANGSWQTRRVTTFDDTISSFGEDDAGELYVIGHNTGTVYRLTSAE
jgi:glucose/arabinose dehydrogenase